MRMRSAVNRLRPLPKDDVLMRCSDLVPWPVQISRSICFGSRCSRKEAEKVVLETSNIVNLVRKMNGATTGLLPPGSRHIPTRRIDVHDPSHMPSAYSTTPGGTIFSTTPGGKQFRLLIILFLVVFWAQERPWTRTDDSLCIDKL